MPGLSQDPEKRERQVAGLREGWKTAAARHAPGKPGKPDPAPDVAPDVAPPKTARKPASGAVAVVPYNEVPDAPAPASAAAEPPREPEPEPERDGFWSGFLGG